MAVRKIPPIRNVLGIIDHHRELPSRGSIGDAWFEETAGLLWVWDEEEKRWEEIGKGQASVVGLAAVAIAGAASLGNSRGARPDSASVAKYVFWKEEDAWIGYFQEFPDYWTQGETLDDLIEHLKDLYFDMTNGQIPGIRRVGELTIP